MIFVFSALNYTCWYDLFKKNRKLQEIFGLQIYIYKDYITLHYHQSVLPNGKSFTANSGTKAVILPKAGFPPQTQEPRLQFYYG